jgi:alkylated DNA repair dioxygenase AlkB
MSKPSLFPDQAVTWPVGLSYLPAFTSPAEEQQLVEAIDAQSWSLELKRRVQHHGYRYDYKSRRVERSMFLGPLPAFASDLLPRLQAVAAFGQFPDQLIVNEYLPGQGISAHVDCEPCFNSRIASVSLGSSCEIEFQHRISDQVFKLTLAAGSLLVIADEARYDWTHQIRPRLRDNGILRQRRISLTFRKVILSPEFSPRLTEPGPN